ncbi:hypothetical protein GCM10009612_72710 [Streptomyces beijiangensis]
MRDAASTLFTYQLTHQIDANGELMLRLAVANRGDEPVRCNLLEIRVPTGPGDSDLTYYEDLMSWHMSDSRWSITTYHAGPFTRFICETEYDFTIPPSCDELVITLDKIRPNCFPIANPIAIQVVERTGDPRSGIRDRHLELSVSNPTHSGTPALVRYSGYSGAGSWVCIPRDSKDGSSG